MRWPPEHSDGLSLPSDFEGIDDLEVIAVPHPDDL
jgi:hypothetical protein